MDEAQGGVRPMQGVTPTQGSGQHSCPLTRCFDKHFLGTSYVPGPCPLLSGVPGSYGHAGSLWQQSQGRDAAAHCSAPRPGMPCPLECTPPQPFMHTVSSYLFSKSQLKSSILFQTFQFTPPQAGRTSEWLPGLSHVPPGLCHYFQL